MRPLFSRGNISSVRRTLVGCLLFSALVGTGTAQADDSEKTSAAAGIHVEILGLRNSEGVVRCVLHSAADTFPMHPDRAVTHVDGKINDRKASCDFDKVPPGTYAVGIFHDEDSSWVFKTNLIGIPKSGYGASNDAKGTFGPPKFDDASFDYKGGEQTIRINLIY